MNEKVRNVFRNSIGYISVALVCLVYIATAFITIGKTGKTVNQIIADGTTLFLLGTAINRLLDMQGLLNGERCEKVQQTMRLHGEIVGEIAPNIDRLDEWCELQNKHAIRTGRTRILAVAGMKYDDFFDDDGVAKMFVPNHACKNDKYLWKHEKLRRRCYQKAVKLKLTPLTASMLTSDGGRLQDPFYFGKTKTEYERKSSFVDMFSKIIVALLFGYYGFDLVKDFSYASLIWTALQVSILLILGVYKMYRSYNFMTDEYRSRIIKKIDHLQKFDNHIKKEAGHGT